MPGRDHAVKSDRFVGEMSWGRFLFGYLLFICLGVAAAVLSSQGLGGDPQVWSLVYLGVLFLVAAIGRPSFVYRVVRNTEWFSGIQRDDSMRAILLVLAVVVLFASMLLSSQG